MPKFLDILGTITSSFKIGGAGAGARELWFVNGSTGILRWNPGSNQIINIPDASGEIVIANNSDNALLLGTNAIAGSAGSIIRKIEIFDKNGASLGFIPVYNQLNPLPPTSILHSNTPGVVSVDWQQTEAVNGWKYQYKLSTSNTWSSEFQTTTKPITLSGLLDGVYDFRVKAFFSASEESAFAVGRFSTLILPVPQFRLTFEQGINDVSGNNVSTSRNGFGVIQDTTRGRVLLRNQGQWFSAQVGLGASYTKAVWGFLINRDAFTDFICSNSVPNHAFFMNSDGNLINGHGGNLWMMSVFSYIFPLNQWTHVAVSYDNTTRVMRMFVNGSQIGSATVDSSHAGSPAPTYIGCYSQNDTWSSWRGYLDNVTQWDVALAPEEIAVLYQQELI